MLYDLWERHRRLIVALCLAACAGLGFLMYRPAGTDSTPLPLETPAYTGQGGAEESHSAAKDHRSPEKATYVDVKGSVKRPGVYAFVENDRIKDAVNRAGGFLPDADVERVNLAQPLSDGMVVWIPSKRQATASTPPTGPPSPPAPFSLSPASAGWSASPAGGTSGREPAVNINAASKEALMSLPGIGESKAQAILAYRQQHGPFRTPADLKKVTGIGDKMYERIKDRIAVH